jgi:peptidoglycan/xylan/chitin deacetylase (PgdA/CDA1 family)
MRRSPLFIVISAALIWVSGQGASAQAYGPLPVSLFHFGFGSGSAVLSRPESGNLLLPPLRTMQSGSSLFLLPSPARGTTGTGVTKQVPPKRQTQLQIPILMYHYIEVVQNPKDKLRQRLALKPSLFEAQLKALKEAGFETVFVRDVPALFAGTLVVKNPVILSVDDGYEDFYTDAFPLLQKYGMKATLYVISGLVGTKDYITADQLREVAESGLVEIGSHTVHHADLPKLNRAKAKAEIEDSKIALERLIGHPVETFAYPFGHYNKQAVALVRAAGYAVAVTTEGGMRQTADGLLTLRRLRPGNAGKNIVLMVGKRVPAQGLRKGKN